MPTVYEIVQSKIVKEIEEAIKNGGTVPWRKPWKGGLPKNYISKKPYRGINLMILPYGGSYITMKQIKDLQKKEPRIKLKKGSKSHIIVFWTFVDKNDDDSEQDENGKYPVLKYYRVFHTSDVVGLPSENSESYDNNPIENAERLIESYKKEVKIIVTTSNRAYYSPSQDRIVVPNLSQFERTSEYYSTMMHEIIHSTGHDSRLKRFDGKDQTIFGSESYSKEELVAEIGSNMLLSILEIDDIKQQENSISYLYGWLTKIKSDPKLITFAAQKAQKAADYVLEFQEGSVEDGKENKIIA